MCGRYGRRADKQRIAEWFHTHNTDVFNDEYYEINSTRLTPSYNISPESIQPVVRLDRDTGERFLAFMKWGLALLVQDGQGCLQLHQCPLRQARV
jgi:putative SOS response-associated peptidase YedK